MNRHYGTTTHRFSPPFTPPKPPPPPPRKIFIEGVVVVANFNDILKVCEKMGVAIKSVNRGENAWTVEYTGTMIM